MPESKEQQGLCDIPYCHTKAGALFAGAHLCMDHWCDCVELFRYAEDNLTRDLPPFMVRTMYSSLRVKVLSTVVADALEGKQPERLDHESD